jgi:hypothetical protein
MHFVKNHFGIGLEARNHNEAGKEHGWENSAWYAGPVFHFNGNQWFVNLGIQPQLFNARKEKGSNETLELTAHEKVQARLLVSFGF